MIQKNKIVASIIALCIFFALGIACSPKNMSYSDFDKWIPNDFDPNNCILLIQKHPLNDKQNKRMEAFLEKNYPYRYEVVDAGLIYGGLGKYIDRSLYKYSISWKFESNYSAASKQMNYDLYGYFIDLNTKKKSNTTKRINNFGQVGYVPFMNSIIKKFKVKNK
jgi:hypothetical protein